ncbi:MAG TPA: ABC transporter ATP-binding protein [Ornithinibacter sp.]|jgi:peptide/nickel transport system ATP-binding protein|uniref:ABC transporter ATP-binding protein n=1 Tax=Ornithinibacter sp. TaxID=2862748 RepID=UPI001B5F1C91|nr:ABC transporter ATP-binding protein [Ornithinibacter sp.]MBP6524230.1 ABC transporter ATP-binding protein [Dermatophilaceae bacterium]HNV41862.1 ABC transporter ATP-binding protein [Ornithinibacter sp.]HOB78712.1 ABC transporter ATP-binding protein [Ornithinibacter sp.]HOT56244.1 ABC transporter ATP-binding protein [Ornithinibacter sp.]HPV90066.1 ABC transporter ATP-binding protein [Ornithinibacter sp.]
MTDTTTQATPPSGDERDVLVDVRGVKVHFPIKRGVIFDKVVGHVYAVDGVDLQIRRGETYGLVGESGCGKSTLGKAILNLEPPTEGSVILDGTDIASLRGEELRRRRKDIQMVFQDPMSSLDPRQSVESLLVEGMRAHGLDTDGASTKKRLRELLAAVGLPAAALTKYPHEFSGGQRQRIGIARALSVEPKLIVADEPVSALDVSVQAQVINLLEELQDEFDLTYLVVAHDLAVVRHISDRIGVMYLGGLVEEAGADDLYGQPLHPYTRALLSAVPVPDPTIEDTREQILLTGDLPSPSNPPPGCRFHTRCPWRQETRCDDERPPLRVVQIDGVDPSHRVACHWVEQIASGEIRPHEVAPVYVAPGDGDAGAIDDDTFTGPASVTEVI